MTTATILTSLVGSDGQAYSSTEKSTAITSAQSILGTSDGDSNAKDAATAMLAQRILINKRKSADNQQSVEELITDEIRSLLTDDDLQSNEDVFGFISENPTETWY